MVFSSYRLIMEKNFKILLLMSPSELIYLACHILGVDPLAETNISTFASCLHFSMQNIEMSRRCNINVSQSLSLFINFYVASFTYCTQVSLPGCSTPQLQIKYFIL